jgi:hypothetical protein
MLGAELLEQLDAIRARQRNIQHRRIALMLTQAGQGVGSAANAPAHREVGLVFQEFRQSESEDGMIVHDHYRVSANAIFGFRSFRAGEIGHQEKPSESDG